MVTLILIFMSPGEWKIVIIVYSFSRCYRLFYVAIKQKLHVYGTNQMYCTVSSICRSTFCYKINRFHRIACTIQEPK